MSLFAGRADGSFGCCGKLCMRNEEFAAFREAYVTCLIEHVAFGEDRCFEFHTQDKGNGQERSADSA